MNNLVETSTMHRKAIKCFHGKNRLVQQKYDLLRSFEKNFQSCLGYFLCHDFLVLPLSVNITGCCKKLLEKCNFGLGHPVKEMMG